MTDLAHQPIARSALTAALDGVSSASLLYSRVVTLTRRTTHGTS